MARYAAVLRGVMPTNASMSGLRAAFEAARFTDVRTVLGSGNVLFTAPAAKESSLERRAEEAMDRQLGRTFLTIVRPVESLRKLVASDPYAGFRLAPGSKRVVTFLREKPKSRIALPVDLDGARILAMTDREIFTAYERTPKGPVFMTLIQKTFGKDLTTRTWETVLKLAR